MTPRSTYSLMRCRPSCQCSEGGAEVRPRPVLSVTWPKQVTGLPEMDPWGSNGPQEVEVVSPDLSHPRLPGPLINPHNAHCYRRMQGGAHEMHELDPDLWIPDIKPPLTPSHRPSTTGWWKRAQRCPGRKGSGGSRHGQVLRGAGR
jgi:hypothetical protein